MATLILAVFVLTYVGMALGKVPGLRTDRSGIALVAAVVIVAATGADLERAVLWLDLPTLALLFGLMVLSAQFGVSGFYDWCAARIAGAAGGPGRLLAVTIAASAGLSAVLANDIIAFAVTPLLCLGVRRRGLHPAPFLIALAAATNVGSAATVIGNPQNILIGQVGGLDFWRFLAVCGAPSAIGLSVIWLVVWLQWHRRWIVPAAADRFAGRPRRSSGPAPPAPEGAGRNRPAAGRLRDRPAARHGSARHRRSAVREPARRESLSCRGRGLEPADPVLRPLRRDGRRRRPPRHGRPFRRPRRVRLAPRPPRDPRTAHARAQQLDRQRTGRHPLAPGLGRAPD